MAFALRMPVVPITLGPVGRACGPSNISCIHGPYSPLGQAPSRHTPDLANVVAPPPVQVRGPCLPTVSPCPRLLFHVPRGPCPRSQPCLPAPVPAVLPNRHRTGPRESLLGSQRPGRADLLANRVPAEPSVLLIHRLLVKGENEHPGPGGAG